MEKLTKQESCPTLANTYNYNGNQIELLPYFLYSVDVYRVSNKRSNVIISKLYTSNSLLDIKEVNIIKRFKTFSIIRYITLLGAPKFFVEENNLPKFELYKKKKS